MKDQGIWFKCRGCGAVAGYFPDGHEANGAHVCAGGIVHTKPEKDMNRTPLACKLWQDSEPAEFWELHQLDPKIEDPDLIPKLRLP